MIDVPWLDISAVARSVVCGRWFQLKYADGLDEATDVNIVRGLLAHERMGNGCGDTERFVKSDALRVCGRADIVSDDGRVLVERKVGKRAGEQDRVQVMLQGFCLEEELGCRLSGATLQLLGSRRRESVAFDDALRARAVDAVSRCRELALKPLLPVQHCSVCRVCMLRAHCFGVVSSGAVCWGNVLSEEGECVTS